MTQSNLFTIHTAERTSEGTAFIQNQDNRKHLEGNCKTLVMYWQRNNIPLSKYDALSFLNVDCLAQRAKNIQDSGIPLKVEKREGERFTRYSIKCQCGHVQGKFSNENCWAHSEKLKVK